MALIDDLKVKLNHYETIQNHWLVLLGKHILTINNHDYC